MSKITNDGLTQCGTGCFISIHMVTVGHQRVKRSSWLIHCVDVIRRMKMTMLTVVMTRLNWWLSCRRSREKEQPRWHARSDNNPSVTINRTAPLWLFAVIPAPIINSLTFLLT